QDSTIGVASFQQALSKSAFGVAPIQLYKETDTTVGVANSTSFFDQVHVDFIEFNSSAWPGLALNNPSVGSCQVYSWSGQDNGPMGSIGGSNESELNAGPALNVSGPNGKMSIAMLSGGGYHL